MALEQATASRHKREARAEAQVKARAEGVGAVQARGSRNGPLAVDCCAHRALGHPAGAGIERRVRARDADIVTWCSGSAEVGGQSPLDVSRETSISEELAPEREPWAEPRGFHTPPQTPNLAAPRSTARLPPQNAKRIP
jgi:hypothetical protein